MKKKWKCIFLGHQDPIIKNAIDYVGIYGVVNLNKNKNDLYQDWKNTSRNCLRCGIQLLKN